MVWGSLGRRSQGCFVGRRHWSGLGVASPGVYRPGPCVRRRGQPFVMPTCQKPEKRCGATPGFRGLVLSAQHTRASFCGSAGASTLVRLSSAAKLLKQSKKRHSASWKDPTAYRYRQHSKRFPTGPSATNQSLRSAVRQLKPRCISSFSPRQQSSYLAARAERRSKSQAAAARRRICAGNARNASITKQTRRY